MKKKSMTAGQAKELLLKEMQERYSIHYAFGWLQSFYLNNFGEELENAVAVAELKEYGIEVEIIK